MPKNALVEMCITDYGIPLAIFNPEASSFLEK